MNLNQPNYQAWLIDPKDFPKHGTIEDKIRFLTGYGVLAPSTHNTQPWLFTVNGNALTIMPDLDLRLKEADPTSRNLYISLGACLYNIEVAAAYFGFNTESEIVSDKKKVSIQVQFHRAHRRNTKLAYLFPAIPKRYSEKRILLPVSLSASDWSALEPYDSSGVSVAFLKDKLAIQQLAADVFQAAASYKTNPLFGRELASWVRSNKTKRFDGMTGRTSGLTEGKAMVGKFLMSNFPKTMKLFAKKYYKQTITSSALGLIATDDDTPEAWILTGKAYEQIALRGVLRNVSLTPMAAMIETDYRQKLRKYFEGVEIYPQMFFRLVKIDKEAVHTPRRLSRTSIQ